MSQLTLKVEARLLSASSDGYSWHFQFSHGINIRAGSLWRLLASGRIRWTSKDHGHQFGLPAPVDLQVEVLKELEGHLLTEIEIDDVGDLRLSFTSAKALQILVDSGGYESYDFWVQGNGRYIALGGGEVDVIERGPDLEPR